MTPLHLRAALASIGWSARELAIRLECHRNTVTDWTLGRRPIPAPVAAWVTAVARYHEMNPAPEWRVRDAA